MTTDPKRPARRATILVWLWLASDIAIALASLWQINALGGFGGPGGVAGTGGTPGVDGANGAP